MPAPEKIDAYGPNLGIPIPTLKCQATYIWIDGTGENLRSKMRVLDSLPTSIDEYPIWNYDGSSTGQATGRKSDLMLKPVAEYPDPFLGCGNNRLVLCETYDAENNPTKTNHRYQCKQIMDSVKEDRPMFGMEQEYLFLDMDLRPLGWPKDKLPPPQGPYYCGVGADRMYGREIVQAHANACLLAGLKLAGTNAEVTPAQWEFQIGICKGIEMGDQLWMARYLLHRVAERAGVVVTLDPKPEVTMGDWNGAGCHTNFSTSAMRHHGGLDVIKSAMKKLEPRHSDHLKLYDPNGGKDNLKRLSGKHETSSVDKFTWGIADRSCSVRIPRQVGTDGKGYLEDRRPSSNCDPYVVTAAIASAILLDKEN
jgi:glutamine synthetase